MSQARTKFLNAPDAPKSMLAGLNAFQLAPPKKEILF